jgi:hypothetical protein
MKDALILKDDANFVIEVNVNGDPATTNGFLCRRCCISITTPEGLEAAGGYDRSADGKWRAFISKQPMDADDTDCEPLGEFGSRDEAVEVLWAQRERAFVCHPRY